MGRLVEGRIWQKKGLQATEKSPELKRIVNHSQ